MHISAPDLPVVQRSGCVAVADRQPGAMRVTFTLALTKYGCCCSTFKIKNSRSLFYLFFPLEPCHIFVICSRESHQTLTCLLFIFLLYISTTQMWPEMNKCDYCWNKVCVSFSQIEDWSLKTMPLTFPVQHCAGPHSKVILDWICKIYFSEASFFPYMNAESWNNHTSIWSLHTQGQKIHGQGDDIL